MRERNISLDRRKYLRKNVQQKVAVILVQILIIITFFTAWEVLANKGVLDSFITSQPSRMLKTLMNLSSNDLLEHLGITCFETLVGFLSGAILGVFVAIVLWWSKFLSKVSEPFLVLLNSLPKIALRTSNHYLGRGRNACYYCNGTIHFFNCYNTRNFKWFYEYR